MHRPWRDLNPRPLDPVSNALSGCATGTPQYDEGDHFYYTHRSITVKSSNTMRIVAYHYELSENQMNTRFFCKHFMLNPVTALDSCSGSYFGEQVRLLSRVVSEQNIL